ncbi:hypothetical protein BJP34_11830 [Moorena producens PAL-8-15-08-1]|uniref:Uncharacterized protein n=1 Tax=Moorena producens PAL-8-15-08-1 TaxID=1458985 RepID=A0A1D8TR23_9CYAN|nr:hypothetical protein BJP34_11830 [Moorena producens PAL-8-15-08-1]
MTPPESNMFPGLSATLREQFYQTVFETHLNQSQYLTLQLLILLLQNYHNVRLSHLAKLFPQPIKYESRVRNLQRFLNLPNLSTKLLWFPIIKQLLKQEVRRRAPNRAQRRRGKKLNLIHQGYLLKIAGSNSMARAKFDDVEFSLG